MRPFRDLSVKTKFVIIILSCIWLALLTACSGFIFYDYHNLRQTRIEHQLHLARLLGMTLTHFLISEDKEAAQRSIRGIEKDSEILSVSLWTKDKKLLASYLRDPDCPLCNLSIPPREGQIIQGKNELVVTTAIKQDGKLIGWIRLGHTYQDIFQKLASYVEITLVVIIVSSFVALFMSWLLGRMLVEPVQDLALTIDRITRRGDYDVILPPVNRGDEVGTLLKGFGEMVHEIQIMDRKAKEDKQQLEKKASRRLNQLETAKAELLKQIEHTYEAETALYKEKEMVKVTLRCIGEGVIAVDREGKVILMSKVAEELTGWNFDQAKARPLDEIITLTNFERDLPERLPVDKVLSSGKRISRDEPFKLVSRVGTRHLVTYSISPISNQEGRIQGAVLAMRDVTERVELEEEVLKARKLESLCILAGGIAHDFNNLLTGITGNISIARFLVKEDSEVMHRLEEAEKALERAKGLTKQLLTFSKGGAPVTETASVKRLVEESANFALSGSNCRLSCQFPDDLWNVEVDVDQISRVVNNLVINACQAMPDGGEVGITCQNIEVNEGSHLPLRQGRYVCLCVEDTGVGISKEHLSKIFDPYFTTKDTGSGLGLSMCYSIVSQHGGHIQVESQIGKGTKFFVYLPASSHITTPTPKKGQEISRGTGKVLVMDDEPFIREVVGEMLRVLGYKADFAQNGNEAIEKYKASLEQGESYFAVIMDLTIPGDLGGKEAIGHLRKMDPHVKAIVSSGYSNDPVMANYSQYGFCAVIVKPFKLDELDKVLRLVKQMDTANGESGFMVA